MLCHALVDTYKNSDQKNIQQFKILEKGKYVTPVQIFEAFLGTADDLAMNDDE